MEYRIEWVKHHPPFYDTEGWELDENGNPLTFNTYKEALRYTKTHRHQLSETQKEAKQYEGEHEITLRVRKISIKEEFKSNPNYKYQIWVEYDKSYAGIVREGHWKLKYENDKFNIPYRFKTLWEALNYLGIIEFHNPFKGYYSSSEPGCAIYYIKELPMSFDRDNFCYPLEIAEDGKPIFPKKIIEDFIIANGNRYILDFSEVEKIDLPEGWKSITTESTTCFYSPHILKEIRKAYYEESYKKYDNLHFQINISPDLSLFNIELVASTNFFSCDYQKLEELFKDNGYLL